MFAVGNKCDREDRCVPTAEAQQLATELNINFVETSAKDNNNVERVRSLPLSLLSLYSSDTVIWHCHLTLSLYSSDTVNLMVWCHGIFQTTSRASPIPTAAVFGCHHLRSLWSDVHGCPPSAIVRFRWLEAASGTVCCHTSRQLQRWLFFRNRLKTYLFSRSFPN